MTEQEKKYLVDRQTKRNQRICREHCEYHYSNVQLPLTDIFQAYAKPSQAKQNAFGEVNSNEVYFIAFFISRFLKNTYPTSNLCIQKIHLLSPRESVSSTGDTERKNLSLCSSSFLPSGRFCASLTSIFKRYSEKM